MKVKIILIALSLLFLAMTFFVVINLFQVIKQEKLSTGQVIINNQVINVELAKTTSQQTQGLSNRFSLAENSGLLFIFPDYSLRSFWMKDMKFPLDFIWIKGNIIVDITPNVPAPTLGQKELPVYQPKTEVNYVLEVNAGYVKFQNIQIGDRVEIRQ
jgi:uncharacterized protein